MGRLLLAPKSLDSQTSGCLFFGFVSFSQTFGQIQYTTYTALTVNEYLWEQKLNISKTYANHHQHCFS